MSGKVVKQAVIPHSCNPGVRWEPMMDEETAAFRGLGKGGEYAVFPRPGEFPKGTVWACDCGQHWVSLGNTCVKGWMHVGLGWRRERWWERRRRLRRTR